MENALEGPTGSRPLERLRSRRSALATSERRFEALFRASPVPTYAWRRAGEDLELVAANPSAEAASGGRAAAYLGKRASEVYADEPEILDELHRCLGERSTFGREMSYTIPGTDETYDLKVTYAFAPADLVLVHLVDTTSERASARELERSLAELRETDRERRRLLRQLVATQERERERIAMDVHDDTIQQLVALSLRLDAVVRRNPKVSQELAALQDQTRGAVERLRHLTFALHPPSLARSGIASAISVLLENLQAETGISCRLVDEISEEPRREVQIHVYRIVQEALTNVRKHAGARSVEVRLATGEGLVTVSVSDDGSGFDPGSTPQDHLGISSIRQRAELLGGRYELESAPGAGTTLLVVLPMGRRGRR